MVQFEVVPGRKGPFDQLVRVWSQWEVLSFGDVLFLLDKYFRSEETYYPKPRYQGATMLFKAIVEVYSGIPLSDVLVHYQLDTKKMASIVEKLPSQTHAVLRQVLKADSNLAEVLT